MSNPWIRKVDGNTVVVFVHGILSNGKTAWGESKASTWPELLLEHDKFLDVSIYCHEYATNLFSNSYSIGDIVADLNERMRLDDIHVYPNIIFVCHSMGGIVVRRLIVAHEAEFAVKGFIGLFLVASPSLGSKYANWLSYLIKVARHSQADKLRFSQDNDWLNDLDKDFQNLKESRRLKLFGKELIEDKFILPKFFLFKQVVEPFSGNRYFAESYKVAGSDHFSIAKPQSADAMQHRLLCSFISKLKGFQPSKDMDQLANPQLITLNTIESTNDHSHSLIAKGHKLPFIVHAWNQSHGRGKTGRVWQGGAGILTATWNFEFSKERSSPEIIGVLSIVTSLAVRDAICTMTKYMNRKVEVKWPNDVLIDGKKVAGILIELSNVGDNKVVSIGVGLNVCRSPILTDRSQFSLPPCSIFQDYNDDNSREPRILNALDAITNALAVRLKQLFIDKGIAGQRTEFENHDFLNGEMILILSPQDKELARGKNVGINNYGQLIVDYGYGNLKEYHSGELSYVRGVSGPDVNMPEPAPKSEVLLNENGDLHSYIRSPMVGTFYRSLSPERPPYVEVGTKVKVGQVICIFEAMKMLNEIEAPIDGTIAEIYFENGDAVDYGVPIFRITE